MPTMQSGGRVTGRSHCFNKLTLTIRDSMDAQGSVYIGGSTCTTLKYKYQNIATDSIIVNYSLF